MPLDSKSLLMAYYAPKDLPGGELYHHFIDNRITKIDDTYYIITPVMVKGYQGTEEPLCSLKKLTVNITRLIVREAEDKQLYFSSGDAV